LDEAVGAAATGTYDLVLVNRIFDANGAEGLELVRRLKADERTAQTPVMMVSNYDDAQDAAVAVGAERGFGKDRLNDAETTQRLSSFLVR
jgi:CheY-like chemotaxis protein